MSVRVSGKQMEVGEAFRSKIEDQIEEAVTKYFDGGYSSQVTVEKAGSGFSADCKVHLDSGAVLHATGKAQDPQAAFDGAFERIAKRLRRYKRKLKDRHHNGPDAFAEVAYTVMDPPPEADDEIPEDYAPAIVAESKTEVRTMAVATAVMALDMTDKPLMLFRNPDNKTLNIVYRRPDGNVGWIDTASITG
ncbi:ribosome hibernation-promoting factor, HPF/YfiA family [Martelella mediterranea]|uniref:Ribosome hibernation promoting factor n=1 Tax=Martelella mediterranea TaxID=293089 RepID=A0A4R3NX28_9HYPH|nr:ribosome-associated translation inhibitor RaiA [Martelella mediterranea]TCT43021.1 putative sigma-54 modulation protein [Martelella mediterranea]